MTLFPHPSPPLSRTDWLVRIFWSRLNVCTLSIVWQEEIAVKLLWSSVWVRPYDRVECSYLKVVMEKWASKIDGLMVWCLVFSISLSVLNNGKPNKIFSPPSVLQQGNLISPFLFILCTEGLSRLLNRGIESVTYSGLKINRFCSAISHIFFLQMTMFFSLMLLTGIVKLSTKFWSCTLVLLVRR